MLKTIDRYIIRKYLGAFFFTCMLFSLISTIVDFSDKVDKFVKADMTAKEIWIDYYLNFIPYINGILWPLFSLISVIFITSRLAKNAEVISILNSGASYWRFLRPYLVGASVLAGLLFFANHLLIPHSNAIRFGIDTERLGKNRENGDFINVHIFLSPEDKVYVRNYNKRDSSGQTVRFEHFERGMLASYMNVSKIKLIEAPNRWRLTRPLVREIDPTGEERFVQMPDEIDTVINLSHTDFTFRKHDKDGMMTPQLLQTIRKEKVKGAGRGKVFEYELHRRTSDPVTIIILTIIGVSIASRKVRGGMGLHLALGIMLGALYIFIGKFAYSFTANDVLSPMLGVWIPNILFASMAFFLVSKAQK